MIRRFGSTTAFLLLLSAMPGAEVFAQTHTMQLETDHFVVDGQARMLLMISYFDAMREYDWSPSELQADFAYLKAHRINGVRVFPNWWIYQFDYSSATYSPYTLFDASGSVRGDRLAVLHPVLDSASAAGLVVDLSFARETVQGLGVSQYSSAIQTVTSNLSGSYPLVFFDIQNERDLSDRPDQYLSTGDVLAIRNAIKAIDPNRIVTASNTSNTSTYDTKQFYFDARLDLVTYHDPRVSDWWDLTAGVIQDLWYAIQSWHPVYLQEPQKWEYDPTPGHYMIAADTAKRYGAAGWTLHSANPGFRLDARNFRGNLYSDQQTILDWYRDTLPATGWSACNFYATPTYQSISTSGGDFSVYFSTRWGCSSAALIGSSTPWIHVTGPSTQQAYEGYYYFHVDSSGGTSRDATIEVANQLITVHQGS